MIKSLKEIDWNDLTNRTYTASPIAWEDQVIYFLLVDRFSNNTEDGFVAGGATPVFQLADNGDAVTNPADAQAWTDEGNTWVGGNINGITNKLGYLHNLGITAIWISPIFKQRDQDNTYHGYAIQNYLEVDQHFGTKEDFKELVDKAHALNIYIILDIVLNHSADIFGYTDSADSGVQTSSPYWTGKQYAVQGFKNVFGDTSISLNADGSANWDGQFANDAVWPAEFQNINNYSRQGYIQNWDYPPEYLNGDFYNLKDLHTGSGNIDDYQPSDALNYLTEVYKYWLAFADLDGFRMDAVKHIDSGAVRFFISEIKEFALTLGKENFYIIGEITGGRNLAVDLMDITGLDAALGIDDLQPGIQNTAKGLDAPSVYFDLFRNSAEAGKDTHTWFNNKIVTMIDDHDKVTQGNYKSRFCATGNGAGFVFNAIALNLTTLGLPCIYYGTEQYFDGQGGSDRYIREAMFGGAFGAFRSKDKHFFNDTQSLYQQITEVIAIRNQKIILRKGRQYLREISGDGINFGLPNNMGDQRILSVIAWSRILDTEEMILAINTDSNNDLTTWIVVDNSLNNAGEKYTCIYPTNNPLFGTITRVEERDGKAISITVPKAGFVIFEKVV